jgi:hypothetical protein
MKNCPICDRSVSAMITWHEEEWTCTIRCQNTSGGDASHTVQVTCSASTPDNALLMALDEWEQRSRQ